MGQDCLKDLSAPMWEMLSEWELLFIKSNDKIIIVFSIQRDLLEGYRKGT